MKDEPIGDFLQTEKFISSYDDSPKLIGKMKIIYYINCHFFGLFQMHVHGYRFRMYLACLITLFEIAKRSNVAKKLLIKSIQECSIHFVSFVVQFCLQECICSCFVMIIRKCLFCFFLC